MLIELKVIGKKLNKIRTGHTFKIKINFKIKLRKMRRINVFFSNKIKLRSHLAERWAILMGLKWSWDFGVQYLVIESDCLELVK